jgi:hypothetical protein
MSWFDKDKTSLGTSQYLSLHHVPTYPKLRVEQNLRCHHPVSLLGLPVSQMRGTLASCDMEIARPVP